MKIYWTELVKYNRTPMIDNDGQRFINLTFIYQVKTLDMNDVLEFRSDNDSMDIKLKNGDTIFTNSSNVTIGDINQMTLDIWCENSIVKDYDHFLNIPVNIKRIYTFSSIKKESVYPRLEDIIRHIKSKYNMSLIDNNLMMDIKKDVITKLTESLGYVPKGNLNITPSDNIGHINIDIDNEMFMSIGKCI